MKTQIVVNTLPDLTIPVRGILWEVYVVDAATMCENLHTEDELQTPCGYTSYGQRRIFLRADLRPTIAKTTLLHEIYHAASEDIVATLALKDGVLCNELAAELSAHASAAVLANAKAVESFLKRNFNDKVFAHRRTYGRSK